MYVYVCVYVYVYVYVYGRQRFGGPMEGIVTACYTRIYWVNYNPGILPK